MSSLFPAPRGRFPRFPEEISERASHLLPPPPPRPSFSLLLPATFYLRFAPIAFSPFKALRNQCLRSIMRLLLLRTASFSRLYEFFLINAPKNDSTIKVNAITHRAAKHVFRRNKVLPAQQWHANTPCVFTIFPTRGAIFAAKTCRVNWLWTKHVKNCLRFPFTSLREAARIAPDILCLTFS